MPDGGGVYIDRRCILVAVRIHFSLAVSSSLKYVHISHFLYNFITINIIFLLKLQHKLKIIQKEIVRSLNNQDFRIKET
jgi:hypothetical protein